MTNIVKYQGRECACFGDLEENSNLALSFEDEERDCIWADGNIATRKHFTNWIDAVTIISETLGEVPLQIEAV